MIALISTEFVKAARRTRSWIVALVLVGLPTTITIAVNAGVNSERRQSSENMIPELAQQSGLLVPVAVLTLMGGFLLAVIAATFAGDSVAGDAAWGNLRYLLMRPVSRGGLLAAKAFVAVMLTWAATLLVVLAGLLAGVLLFGVHAVDVPASGLVNGFELSTGDLLARAGLATGYVAFSLTAVLAIGIFVSTLTDSPASAIGATVGSYLLFQILGGISALGRVRYLFPTYYANSWTTMFTHDEFSGDMLAGVLVQLGYLVVFGGVALVWFRRKDIMS